MRVKKIKSSRILTLVAAGCACGAFGWYLHGRMMPDMSQFMRGGEAPHVLVQALKESDVSAKKKYIAVAEAINSVDVTPQVSGYLTDILFQDGAFVNAGDVLFQIDRRKYDADLKAAEAAVKQTQNEFKRISALHKSRDVSDRERDTAESNLKQAEANLDLARLNVEWATLKSPISGFIGKALVTKGNLVGVGTQKLARVVQTQPIRIVFSVTDKERSDFMAKAARSEDVFADIALPNGTVETVKAKNLFFDNEVNPDTATIPVYLETDNADNLLVPGNYVDIYLRFAGGQTALLVPQVALSADVHGTYVMTVGDDNKVTQKYLQLGDVIEDWQVVLSGLNKSDRVIVQGLQKVQPGLTVVPQELTTRGE